jgi:hypothetical protein
MKSYISRKFPLETRTTDQILDLRSVAAIIWSLLIARSVGSVFEIRKRTIAVSEVLPVSARRRLSRSAKPPHCTASSETGAATARIDLK